MTSTYNKNDQQNDNSNEHKVRGIHVFINRHRFDLPDSTVTGRVLKELAGIPLTDVFFLREPGKDLVVGNDGKVTLKNGDHCYSQPPADYGHEPQGHGHAHKTEIFINRARYELANPEQTGRSLKVLAAIPLTDVLFLRRPGQDLVVINDEQVTLKNGDHCYSQPPADYGNAPPTANPLLGGLEGFRLVPQRGGWVFAINDAYELPDAYLPRLVRLLVKLPPTFPDAAPDMFFVTPVVRTANGGAPVGTSEANILGEVWQQFSWHLKPGAWKPGISDFREYMRCVRSRIEKRN